MRSAEVALKLEEKKDEEGWSQAELARRLGVTEATVSRVLSGKRRPGATVILAMLALWPGIFSEDGGNDGHREGDEPDRSDSPGVAAADQLLLLPVVGAAGDLDD